MRLLSSALLLATTILIAGCSRELPVSDTSDAVAAADLPTANRQARSPQLTQLINGRASIACNIDELGTPINDQEITEFSSKILQEIRDRCRMNPEFASLSKLPQVRVSYEGEINSVFSELIRTLEEQANVEEIPLRILEISSGGGSIHSAMAAGNAIGDSGWYVHVPEDGNCMSACVLVIAAAESRRALGDVGIHRVFPPNSNAKTRNELLDETRAATELIRRYLTKHGVSASLADEMMAIPSNEIRLLKYEELDELGLGYQNVAGRDLARLQFVRRCGLDFVQTFEAVHRECSAASTRAIMKEIRTGIQRGDEYGNCLDTAEKLFPPGFDMRAIILNDPELAVCPGG